MTWVIEQRIDKPIPSNLLELAVYDFPSENTEKFDYICIMGKKCIHISF